MASITLTGKVKDPTVSSTTSQDNAAWANLIALWPFWDTAIGVASGTWTDLLGGSGTFTNTGGLDFTGWTTSDPNVEIALGRVSHTQLANGLAQVAAAFGGATQTHVFVVKPDLSGPDDPTRLLLALGTNNTSAVEFRFDATGHIVCLSLWPDAIFTTVGRVPGGEWHAVGIAFNATTGNISVCIDGGTVETFSFNPATIHFNLTGNTAKIWEDIRASDYGQHAFAFWGAWSVKQSDAWLQDITNYANNKPYRMLLAGSGATPNNGTIGVVTTAPTATAHSVTRTVSGVLKDIHSNAVANATGLHWEWRDSTDVGGASNPTTDRGVALTTDAGGNFSITLANSAAVNGQQGRLEIAKADLTAALVCFPTVAVS